MALRTLCGIATNGESESARVAAAIHLLDRGWGKPPQAHTGENGEGDIWVIIRHITKGRDEALDAQLIDATLVQPEARHMD
jgi:hypothetical protein